MLKVYEDDNNDNDHNRQGWILKKKSLFELLARFKIVENTVYRKKKHFQEQKFIHFVYDLFSIVNLRYWFQYITLSYIPFKLIYILSNPCLLMIS